MGRPNSVCSSQSPRPRGVCGLSSSLQAGKAKQRVLGREKVLSPSAFSQVFSGLDKVHHIGRGHVFSSVQLLRS